MMCFWRTLTGGLPVCKDFDSKVSVHPSLLPSKDYLGIYGVDEISTFRDFYDKADKVKFDRVTYSSPPLLNREDLLSEWKILRRTLFQENDQS